MRDVKQIWQVATVYVGTIIGAGFATGKEIVTFFSRFGLLGFLGILVAGYLFVFFGNRIMLIAIRIGANDYYEFNRWLFGERFSKVISFAFFLMLIGVTGVMLSGAGEVLFQQFHLEKSLGMILTAFLAIVVMWRGLSGLSMVNMLVVPMMLLFNIILAWIALTKGFSWSKFVAIPFQEDMWSAMFMPFAYVAFNLALAQSVFVPLAKAVGNPTVVKRGGILGGTIITAILVLGHLSLITFPEFQQLAIPAAAVMKAVAPFLHAVYLLIIFGEIFSTVIGNAYGIERQLHTRVKLSPATIYILLFLSCLLIGQFDYGKLLTTLYPIFGYFSIVFLGMLLVKRTSQK